MKDALGDRMKQQYENRTQYMLPRRSYTVIRVDGKAFHTYTRHCKKPFDPHIIEAMNFTALNLCQNIDGAKIGYVQSDEISILLTDFDTIHTQAWFDGNIQKMASVSAGMATAYFLAARNAQGYYGGMPSFDSRVFTIPDPVEVYNYFLWRQKDAIRNSVLSLAQATFSHSRIQGKKKPELLEMLREARQPWEDIPKGTAMGRFYVTSDEEIQSTIRGTPVATTIRKRWEEAVEDISGYSNWIVERIPKL